MASSSSSNANNNAAWAQQAPQPPNSPAQRDQSRAAHRNKAAQKVHQSAGPAKGADPMSPNSKDVWPPVPNVLHTTNRRQRVATLQQVATQLDIRDEMKKQHVNESAQLAELRARTEAHEKKLGELERQCAMYSQALDDAARRNGYNGNSQTGAAKQQQGKAKK